MIGSLTFLDIGIFIGCLLVAMSFHEAMHGFVAHWLGDDTAHLAGRLTLNPLKHIDVMLTILLPLGMLLLGAQPILAAKPVPFNPGRLKYDEFGAALVGLAGPASNLLLAIAAAAVMHLSGVAVGTLPYTVFITFISLNIALFTFNLLPIPPLDGSRVLFAFAPEPLQKIMLQIEQAGFAVILVILILLIPVIGPILSNINEFLVLLLV